MGLFPLTTMKNYSNIKLVYVVNIPWGGVVLGLLDQRGDMCLVERLW